MIVITFSDCFARCRPFNLLDNMLVHECDSALCLLRNKFSLWKSSAASSGGGARGPLRWGRSQQNATKPLDSCLQENETDTSYSAGLRRASKLLSNVDCPTAKVYIKARNFQSIYSLIALRRTIALTVIYRSMGCRGNYRVSQGKDDIFRFFQLAGIMKSIEFNWFSSG